MASYFTYLKEWLKKDKEAQLEAVKRLGLPANNTAADRAKAMGFSDETYYHGTDNIFDGFDNRFTSGNSDYNNGVSFISPNQKMANQFTSFGHQNKTLDKLSQQMGEIWDSNYNAPNIKTLKINANKIFDIENTQNFKELTDNLMPKFLDEGKTKLTEGGLHRFEKTVNRAKDGYWEGLENPKIQDTIKELGYDGFYVREYPELDIGNTKNIGIYNPANIRSPLAHFNPKYAGIGGAGAVMSGNLMADELDLEYKGQEPSTWDSLMNTIGGVNQEQAQAYGDTGAGAINIATMLATDPAVAGEVISTVGLKGVGAVSPYIKGFGAGLLLDSGEASASPKYSDEDFINKLEGR